MFAAWSPLKPINCSLIRAGARCDCPCWSWKRYLVWYCPGAKRRLSACHLLIVSGFSLQCCGEGRPCWSGAGVVRQWNKPDICIVAGAVNWDVSSCGCNDCALGLCRRRHWLSVCFQCSDQGVCVVNCVWAFCQSTEIHQSLLRCMMPPSSASTMIGSIPNSFDKLAMSCWIEVCGTTFSMRT